MEDELTMDANPDPFYEPKTTQLHAKLSTLFTKKRIQIIETINAKKPKTVGELANILQRNISAVYRDLKVLEEHEVVFLEKRGKSVRPLLKNTSITINLVHEVEATEKSESSDESTESANEDDDYVG